MGKGIYTYYKERLIEIGGNSKCLYLKGIVRKGAYDIGRIFEGRDAKVAEFVEFLWSERKYPLTLIGAGENKEILENLDVESKIEAKLERPLEGTVLSDRAVARNMKIRREETKRAIESEINKLKDLKRETEEIERETGRYELFLGYPFVFGSINQSGKKTLIKAPLLLFPVKIDIPDESTVEIRFNESEKIHINPALVFAYAQSKRINVDQLELDFDSLSQFGSISDIIDYLRENHVKIDCVSSKNIYSYSRFKEPEDTADLEVRYGAVLARFPLSNSIYNDYTALEKKKLTNDAIDELLRTGSKKVKRRPLFARKKRVAEKRVPSYTVKTLDYAQSEVVRKVDEKGNMVIYGPPGTGKSQTIVNAITDSLCKHKRVLVVSQKKAALDVVFNRLGVLNEKCMYINDESKEKRAFYERCLSAHMRVMGTAEIELDSLEAEFAEVEGKIAAEEDNLSSIFTTLNEKRPFGLSLAEMYSSSYMIQKNSNDYAIYLKLIENKALMALDYKEFSDALFSIKDNELEKIYYDFMQAKEKNPLIDLMQESVDIRTLSEVKGKIEEIQKSRKGLFNTAQYPYYRHVMAYYKELGDEETLDSLVKFESRIKYPKKLFPAKVREQIRREFIDTLAAVDAYAKEYECLRLVLTEDGYINVIDNLVRGNISYIKLVYDALDNYIAMRDITKLLEGFDKSKTGLLNFAYSTSKSYSNYVEIINKLLSLRIYHEIIYYEEACKDDLAKMVDYQSIRTRILRLKEEQQEISRKITAIKGIREYETIYAESKDNKDYLYQISKTQKFWPIRKTVEMYESYILSLFPCWLLSPENVSSILPLTKNLFDVVIFDEASQVFIESTIPTIYRGKNIVVAGDAKQLRPSTTFMKRYLGADPEAQEDVAVQAALEVDSLLDLAVARYESANLTYHYRSRHSELIDFSNSAFYGSDLQVAPNISKNKDNRPIERIKVNGKWVDRKNVAEAKEIVALLDRIFKTRKNNESIGIITFNSDQQSCIADQIDREMSKNPEFRSSIINERHRIENGEDISLFIKNLENVQGDERDIIIFSIGYAKNDEGKVYANFGSLSAEGGENRLNVAITRAKSKIYIVTSIEPEELKVDSTKHLGPKLLKSYLTYARAVSCGRDDEVKTILSELNPEETKAESAITPMTAVEEQIKERLTKLGYCVDTKIGNRNNRISLAIYDEQIDRYLVGVELDKDAFLSSSSTMERDVYKPSFLESRGWTLLRVWCRDWWLYPQRVIKAITQAAEETKERLK
ncbi:MAG: DUF4011 domain-containing protein [Clostridia bacterium]|nr:DUF4011 domain-containing protein [Clostridia bacterium]